MLFVLTEKYGFRRKTAPFIHITDQSEVAALGDKLSRETAASKAARHDFDPQREHVKYLEKCDPNYPGNSKCIKMYLDYQFKP